MFAMGGGGNGDDLTGSATGEGDWVDCGVVSCVAYQVIRNTITVKTTDTPPGIFRFIHITQQFFYGEPMNFTRYCYFILCLIYTKLEDGKLSDVLDQIADLLLPEAKQRIQEFQ